MAIVDLGSRVIEPINQIVFFDPIILSTDRQYQYLITLEGGDPSKVFSNFVLSYKTITGDGFEAQNIWNTRFFYSTLPIQGILSTPRSDENRLGIAFGITRIPYWSHPSQLSEVIANISLNDQRL